MTDFCESLLSWISHPSNTCHLMGETSYGVGQGASVKCIQPRPRHARAGGHPVPHRISSHRSCHWGLRPSMRRSFQPRCHFLSCFSPRESGGHIPVDFIMHQAMNPIFPGEPFHQVVLVLPDALPKIAAHPDVERSAGWPGCTHRAAFP